ncbi:translation initiation factor IF-2-like [Cervus elaphus]|uniref:translation initiation factor IF-2-like n=1 Tax=Cervus elaphus TaxID=9860 RepID=UPI001CC30EA8|nr:translation initiation factor IF-2-like [Cervus elaphus]
MRCARVTQGPLQSKPPAPSGAPTGSLRGGSSPPPWVWEVWDLPSPNPENGLAGDFKFPVPFHFTEGNIEPQRMNPLPCLWEPPHSKASKTLLPRPPETASLRVPQVVPRDLNSAKVRRGPPRSPTPACTPVNLAGSVFSNARAGSEPLPAQDIRGPHPPCSPKNKAGRRPAPGPPKVRCQEARHPCPSDPQPASPPRRGISARPPPGGPRLAWDFWPPQQWRAGLQRPGRPPPGREQVRVGAAAGPAAAPPRRAPSPRAAPAPLAPRAGPAPALTSFWGRRLVSPSSVQNPPGKAPRAARRRHGKLHFGGSGAGRGLPRPRAGGGDRGAPAPARTRGRRLPPARLSVCLGDVPALPAAAAPSHRPAPAGRWVQPRPCAPQGLPPGASGCKRGCPRDSRTQLPGSAQGTRGHGGASGHTLEPRCTQTSKAHKGTRTTNTGKGVQGTSRHKPAGGNGEFFTTSATWEAHSVHKDSQNTGMLGAMCTWDHPVSQPRKPSSSRPRKVDAPLGAPQRPLGFSPTLYLTSLQMGANSLEEKEENASKQIPLKKHSGQRTSHSQQQGAADSRALRLRERAGSQFPLPPSR